MSLAAADQAPTFTARQGWIAAALFVGAIFLWMLFGVWPAWLEWLPVAAGLLALFGPTFYGAASGSWQGRGSTQGACE